MRDVTEELVSAYVDGELEGDELKLVESLLAESAEHRQLLAEFQSLRASLWSLPASNLPADFHTRVIAQIDGLAVSTSKEPVQRAGRRADFRAWRSAVLAAASLAAVVALTVMLEPPGEVRRGSRNIETVPVFLRVVPRYIMVYDVTVTPNGQANNTVEKQFNKLGIAIDPAQRLDRKVEGQLRAIRESKQVEGTTDAVPYTTDPATPKSTGRDTVEMFYVAGNVDTLSQLGTEFKQLSKAGEDVVRIRYDLVEETNKFGPMHRLHNSACHLFASSRNVQPADAGYAISFHMELKNITRGVAAFPSPTIYANWARQPDSVAHILVIVRNVDANADGAK